MSPSAVSTMSMMSTMSGNDLDVTFSHMEDDFML